MPDYEAMTIDELDEFSVTLKGRIEAIRDERRDAKVVRDRKVTLAALAQKLGIDVAGLTPEQAAHLLDIAKQTPPKPGDVVVTPDPAALARTSQTSEVQS
jgi:hypothetical protein